MKGGFWDSSRNDVFVYSFVMYISYIRIGGLLASKSSSCN